MVDPQAIQNLMNKGFTQRQALSILNKRQVEMWLYVDWMNKTFIHFPSEVHAKLKLPQSQWNQLIPTVTIFESI